MRSRFRACCNKKIKVCKFSTCSTCEINLPFRSLWFFAAIWNFEKEMRHSWPKIRQLNRAATINSEEKLRWHFQHFTTSTRGRKKSWHLVCSKVLPLIDWILAFHAPEWQSIVESINNFKQKGLRSTFIPQRLRTGFIDFPLPSSGCSICWLIDSSCHSEKLKFKFQCD